MSVQQIVKEAMDKNPTAFEEALKEELSARIALAIEAKMADEVVEDVDLSEADDRSSTMKDGYYVTNQRHSELTHDKPFLDSKTAIRHADKGENASGYVHRIHKVKGGKIDKQWEYNGGHMEGGWEHFSDFKGDNPLSHIRKVPSHLIVPSKK